MDGVIAILLLLLLFVFVMPIVALAKAASASTLVRELRLEIEALRARLAKLSNTAAELEQVRSKLEALERRLGREGGGPAKRGQGLEEVTKPEPSAKPATAPAREPVAKPEPELATGLSKDRAVEPVAEPSQSEAAKLAKTAGDALKKILFGDRGGEEKSVAAKTELEERGPKAAAKDKGSIEMKLGTYWFVRIGVVLLLTGAGILAYYNREFFFNLSKGAKVFGLYLLCAAMGGVGFWLQRARENLKNYGQVLLAGGCAGVYFTTYAAHIFEPVRVIQDPTIALLLLLAWGALIVWIADRLKSETLGLFAIGASYYATYVPLIHSGAVSDWVILASNVILAVAAVVFMLRNRWLKMPVLSMAAAYGGLLIWRMRVLEEPELFVIALFAGALWVVYTAAVFLSKSDAFGDLRRATFLTANNGALFGLLSLEVLGRQQSDFWILPMVLGSTLIGCALAASRLLSDQPHSRNAYLTQGLVLVTLGLMTTQLSDSVKGPVLAAQSTVMLVMAIRRDNTILQAASFVVAGIAAIYGFIDIDRGSESFLAGSLSVAAFLLCNAVVCHRRVEGEMSQLFRPQISYFAGFALALGLTAIYNAAVDSRQLGEWVPAILIGVAALVSASVYILRLRELVFFAQVPAGIGLALALGHLAENPQFSWPACIAFLVTLGFAHWWRWQGAAVARTCADPAQLGQAPSAFEAIFSAGVVWQLLVWSHTKFGFREEWLWLGSILSVGFAVYGMVTRAPYLAAFAQAFLVMACVAEFNVCIAGAYGGALMGLVPIGTLYLGSVLLPIVERRLGELPEVLAKFFRSMHGGYRIAAAAMALLWIHRFVPDGYHVLVVSLLAVGFALAHGFRPAREWHWLALAYGVVAALYLSVELSEGVVRFSSLVGILAALGLQQLARRVPRFALPEVAHDALVPIGGLAVFFWATVAVGEWAPAGGGDGLRSITWAGLAVLYFSLGLGLRERRYRLMGLGTLGVALISLVPIIWQMQTEWKIASFFVLGMVFVGLGFIYNHYKEPIRKLL